MFRYRFLHISAAFVIFYNIFMICAAATIEAKSNETNTIKSQVNETQSYEQLFGNNFLVGIANFGIIYENQTQCGQELEIFKKAIINKELWSLKVLDSFGSPPRTFLWGNYFWFGTPDLCDDIFQPLRISLGRSQPLVFNATSPFAMRFSLIYMNFSTPYYIDLKLPYENLIHLGLCLPKSCSLSKIRFYSELYFASKQFQMQRNFKLSMKAVKAKVPHFSWTFFTQTGSLIFIAILLSIILLTIFAEILYKSKENLLKQQKMHIKNYQNGQQIQMPQNNNTDCKTDRGNSEMRKSSFAKSLISLEELLLCFRLPDNYKTVMKVENSNCHSNYLNIMTGMRTIICLWITVFHAYYYSLYAMSNASVIFAKLENFILQPIMQACFYVDVFFVMSSFLLAFNFLSNKKQIELLSKGSLWFNIKHFTCSIIKRYLRLTPVMLITMLLGSMFVNFLNMYSPFYLGEHSGFHCESNWWYNLLYIHNLLDMNNICCSWTWYLACEMQYFIFFLGLLHFHVKYPKMAKMLFIILVLGFMVIGWLLNYSNGITFEIDVIYTTLNELYVKPWIRIPPYLGGFAMGWLMHRLKERKSETINRVMEQQQQQQQQHHEQQQHHQHVGTLCCRLAFWTVCICMYVATNFISYWRQQPKWLVATIMSVGKMLFALCIGGIIILGRAGPLEAMLSARPFRFLNKFCYSVYMLAPVIVVTLFGLRNEPTTFTEVASGADFIAIIVLSFASSFLLVLLVELPLNRVSNILLRSK